MKQVTLFVLENCPHCRRARSMMEELFAEHPEYATVELTVIDEAKEPAVAARYDYYYVPTFYLDGEKRLEGAPSKEAIDKLFAEACS